MSCRLRRIFAGLDARPYLGDDARREFRFYAELFEEALLRIDRKVAEGRLKPLAAPRRPESFRPPEPLARVGIFIGSFDPFQMTHLAAALRFLASERCGSDIVLVAPEGGGNPDKPRRTDYRFRYELLRLQVAGILSPFVLPLDLGEGADTIGVVERLLGRCRPGRLELTHLLGSDALPLALRYLPEDLAAWSAAAARAGVELDLGAFVILRGAEGEEAVPGGAAGLEAAEAAYRSRGLRFAVDERRLSTPSSSDFRARGALTIVLPTDAVLGRLELLFRYSMNRPWMEAGSAGKAEQAGEPERASETGQTGKAEGPALDYEI